MSGTKWTTKEDELLRKQYKRVAIGVLAGRLSRSVSSVYQRANRLGLHQQRNKAEIDDRKVQIKALLEIGMSDSEVAEQVGMDRRALTEMRFRMGIAANGRNERYRKRVAEKTREQCKLAGVKNLGQIRAKRFAECAALLGWSGLSVRSAQIADSLYRNGPMTRKQICESIGMPWNGSRKSLASNRVPGGSYMAELQRAGIVVRLESAITHKGKGNHEDLYMIGLDVEPCKKAQ